MFRFHFSECEKREDATIVLVLMDKSRERDITLICCCDEYAGRALWENLGSALATEITSESSND